MQRFAYRKVIWQYSWNQCRWERKENGIEERGMVNWKAIVIHMGSSEAGTAIQSCPNLIQGMSAFVFSLDICYLPHFTLPEMT